MDASIRRAVEPIEDISLLVLFGSRAGRRIRDDSDLDVAVLPGSGDPVSRRKILSCTASALAGIAPGGRVDVVLLDEAPELLRHQIMKTGRVVLARDPAAWRAWRVRTMREHGDREPYRRLLASAQRRRLTNGGAGGRSGRALESLERARGLPR